MISNQDIIYSHKPGPAGAAAAARECCRILAAVFLSLLVPLSFLLLARLSISRHLLSITSDRIIQPPNFPFLISFLTLTFLVLSITIAALANCLTGYNAAVFISERRRLCAGWALLFVIQFCLSLGIFGTADTEIDGYAAGDLAFPVRLFFAFGLHEITVFWWVSVVEPVVDEAIFGVRDEGFVMSWVEKVVLAAAFGNLWWRRLREEAEALVVLPRVGAAGGFGWWLYYLTAAAGAVRVVKGFVWVVTWIFRKEIKKKKKQLVMN